MRARLSVGLFCSASDLLPEAMKDLARRFGARCADNGYRLVYGGGSRGLMGEAARGAQARGGEILGIIPGSLRSREQAANAAPGQIIVVDTLSQRKERMAAESDAFVVLPGGVGTLDELFEMITWNDLCIQDKPIVLCAEDGFWNPLQIWFSNAQAAGALRPGATRRFSSAVSLDEAFATLAKELRTPTPAPPPRVSRRHEPQD